MSEDSADQEKTTSENEFDPSKLPTMEKFLDNLQGLTPEDLANRQKEGHKIGLEEDRRADASYIKENLPAVVKEMMDVTDGEIPQFIKIDEVALEHKVPASTIYGPEDGNTDQFPVFDQAVKEGNLGVVLLALRAKESQLKFQRDVSGLLARNDVSKRQKVGGAYSKLVRLNRILSRRLNIPNNWEGHVQWKDLLTPAPSGTSVIA